MTDPYGRQFKSLRVSLTSACNYACTYCTTHPGALKPLKDALKMDKLAGRVVALTEHLGLSKLRLTGGEPLIAPQLQRFLDQIAPLDVEKSITTNAEFLTQWVEPLKAAGFERLNISLDTLDPRKFTEVTRGGDLHAVLDGIAAAKAAGMALKLNTVPMKGINEHELPLLHRFCMDEGIQFRLIELMRMGHLSDPKTFHDHYVSLNDVLSVLDAPPIAHREPNATAHQYRGRHGPFWVIGNESSPFCEDCDRLRIDSAGRIYGCITATLGVDADELGLDAALDKAMAQKQPVKFQASQQHMQRIGG